MATEFKLPEVSEGVESADIAEVHVAEGDTIKAGQAVFSVETEKAVADIDCPYSGKVTKIHVKPGDTVKIGAPLLTIEEGAAAGGDDKPAKPAPSQEQKEVKKAAESPARKDPELVEGEEPAVKSEKREEPARAAVTKPRVFEPTGPERAEVTFETQRQAEPAGNGNGNGQDHPPVPAAPATRRLARELGVDLHRVSGSGPGGRITQEDVQAFVKKSLASGKSSPAAGVNAPALPDFSKYGEFERQPLSKLARTAASNLSVAWNVIPHVTQHDLADITELEDARKRYSKMAGQSGPKVTMTAIMAKAVVGALRAFPQFNSSIDMGAGELVLKKYFHIGIAVDTEHGLVVPVIRDVDRKSVIQIAAELGEIAERARARKLTMDDMQGGTFTITNLGGIGGTAFTPIVNYPEVAILGMSRTQTQLQMIDGEPVERLMLPLSLSYDHRVINGADAARFIVKLSSILADFFRMMIEC